MAAHPQPPLTAAEYESLPEALGFKDELIEGERVLSPMPKKVHTIVLENLEEILKGQIEDARVVRESGWYFRSLGGAESVPGPDLMVLSVEDYDRTTESGWFEGRPLFTVEVISPSERKSRRMQKVGLYLEAGAGAVVEVDPAKQLVLIHSPEGDLPEVIASGRVTWPFQAELGEIFARVQ